MSILRPPKKKIGVAKSSPNPRSGGSDYAAPSSGFSVAPMPTYGGRSTHDSAYDAANALAGRSLNDQLAYLSGQAQMLRTNYGYADDNFTMDLTNPFGQAQLLKKTFDQNKRGTENSYAARGQMTSGAYNRQQGANLSNYQQADDQLQKSYLSDRAGILNAVRQAQSQYGVDTMNNEGSALDRALQRRDAYQTTAPGGSKGLASNERIAKSAQDGQQYVYRLKDGKWLRVRKA